VGVGSGGAGEQVAGDRALTVTVLLDRLSQRYLTLLQLPVTLLT
jgi:hypothetical protein